MSWIQKMAWNEPGRGGDNNDRDPWGNNKQGGGRGQPDLDDALKDLGRRLGGIFGGGSGSNRSGGGMNKLLVFIVFGVIAVTWLVSGFYTIKEAERGVLLRFGKFVELVPPGLHWRPTFVDDYFPVDVESRRTLSTQGFMLTQDENVARVEMELQYRVIEPQKFLFAVTNAQSTMAHAIDSALRYVVGHTTMDNLLTLGKEQVRQDTWRELERIIETYDMGIEVVDVNFENARPPEPVKDAFDDAVAAKEDQDRYIKEAQAYAREREPKARGAAKRMLENAEAYKSRVTLEAEGQVARFEKLLPEYLAAPEVTRKRLYLETMEQVLGSTSKILIDQKEGGNLLYLPLDQILKQRPQEPAQLQDDNYDLAPISNGQPTPINSSSRSNSRANSQRGGR